ncbi:MAG TPA: ABC transporter permease [Bacilli bacterium]|nr:ABC transporter permease [Bacilli bacterium]
MQKLSLRLMNPVLVKEFRGRMRTIKTPILLLLYLLAISIVTFGYIYISYSHRNYYNPGETKELFMILTVAQLILVAFVAPGLTAGTISGERERQTLNILLTTHLSPTKIVLSKMASSLSFIALLVVATLPIYAVVFLFGGVSPGQVLGIFGFYLVTMVLFGAIGMFCSAWFKRTGVAVVVAYGLCLFILGATALIAVFVLELLSYQSHLNGQYVQHPNIFYLSALNPVLNLISLFEPDAAALGQNMPTTPGSTGSSLPMAPWLYYLVVYLPFSALLLFFTVRMITPVKRPLLQAIRGRNAAKKAASGHDPAQSPPPEEETHS